MGLFDWFRSALECPVDAPTRAWLDHRWGWLEAQFGPERARAAPVVLPSPEFFPDAYAGTPEDARCLLDRVCGYMGVDPGRVELWLYGDQSPIPATSPFAGTWQGTAGLYQAVGDKFRISIEASHLGDPLSVVATMAHELGHVHLLGGGRLTGDEEDHEPLTDLLTVYLGLGVLTANSVVRESSWKDGNMSGWSISRCGYTDMRTYGYALARFARLRDEDAPPWSRQLRPDVRQAFRQSARFLQAEATAAP